MVKAKLCRQNHTQKHTHTHSQKEKKGKQYIYISLLPKSTSSIWDDWLGEKGISLSLLCWHSSQVSALDLAPPLRVGRLRASVLRSDRTGLKELLIRGLWLTLAGGREEYGVQGEPTAAEAGMTLHQREAPAGVTLRRHDVAHACGAPCVLPGKLSLDHGTLAVAGCTGSREGRCLLPLRQVQTFSWTPSQLAVVINPFRLCSRCQPQSSPGAPTNRSPSLSSQPRPPWRVSRQASRAGECWSPPILCARISSLCAVHPCCCALLRGSEASPLRHPQSLPAKGLPSVWKPFLLHGSLPLVQVPSLFFCLCLFIFLLPYPGTWGVSCLLGSLRSSASVQ
ncbi:uncharacterized protein LOC125961775 [Orcinus orca]|uniref:uncharacterized protein LOC125961775 n=1 Tax=Orcinus orca TaxID=9733 RepID=UPI0021134079|nr:uncharacterized protein LOC125961775 [Orcinus orca]